MKIIFVVFAATFLLIGCQPEHLGCSEQEIASGQCQVSESPNADIFSDLDESRVSTDTVDYSGYQGFLAQPSEPGSYPGVVMIHEWWGLNDNIKQMAKLLTQQGYVVLAVDLYGGQSAETQERAMELSSAARKDPQAMVANMRAAASYLKTLGVTSMGSLGWCFGGGQSLQLALSGEKLDATVIYYGSLESDPEKLKVITWPVLGIFGELDTGIPVASVQEFKSSLDSLGIENEIYIYPGVGHAFANPSGARYAPDETRDAWDKTLEFFSTHLI